MWDRNPLISTYLTELNQLIHGTEPYPHFGYLEAQFAEGNVVYHSLETSLKRRFSKGLSFIVAYTWCKSIDDTPEELENNSGGSQNGYDPSAWCGPSDFDFPQWVTAGYVFELPFRKGKPWNRSGIAAPNVIGTTEIVGNVNCWFYASNNKACAANCTQW
jgi:hypothetical protein